MKKYVFLVPTVAGMGGAQMYIRNKLLYLRQHGWMVDVIVAQNGHAQLPELQEFQFEVSELTFEIFNYSNRKKRVVVNKIVNKIQDPTVRDFVIESTCISESSWAEAIAKRVDAKHIAYLLQEDNVLNNKGIQDFFLFKHKRRELIGITDQSLFAMFSTFHPILKEESYWLPAYCNNVEADVDSPYIELLKDTEYDYLIGMLSRLEKPFVVPSIKDFCQFAIKHQDKKFLLLLMGDAPKGSEVLTRIREVVKKAASNVNIIATGYLYPVPTKLLEMCDAFFTSAGSAWVCMRSGVPTITYDGNDFMPIGVLGRTTMNSLFRDDDDIKYDFSFLMDHILFEKKYRKETPNYAEGLPDFGDHIRFLLQTSQEKDYFEVEAIQPTNKTDYKLKLALGIFGPRIYCKLGFLKTKWINK